MPVSYTKSGGQGHVYQVPDYPEAADGPKAFKDFADFLDLILPPVGTIMPFVGGSAPTGWLLCDGTEWDSSAYPKLSTLCGTKFGTAAAGKFKVPNLKGRTVVGLDTSDLSGSFDTLGKTGGAKSVTLTVSNMPEHSHSVPNHTHTGSITGITGSADTESGHTHGAGTIAPVGNTGTHGHTGGTLSTFVSDVTSTSNNTQSGTGVQRVTSLSVTKDYVSVMIGTSGTQGGHTHSMTGSTDAGSSHSHNLSITGGTLSMNSSGATTTGNAGTASPTAISTMSPYLTLNHIIRAA